MQAFILIGARQEPGKGRVVENLYTGLDGVALQKAADAAAESGKYESIHKLVNPSSTPMPVKGAVVTRTTPSFPRSKAVEVAKTKDNVIDEREAAINKQRQERLSAQVKQTGEGGNVDVTEPPKPGTAPLSQSGPTLEEYVASGYDPKNYPPKGYAERPSAGLELFRKTGQAPVVSTAKVDAEKAEIEEVLETAAAEAPAATPPPAEPTTAPVPTAQAPAPAVAQPETTQPVAEAPASPAAAAQPAGKKAKNK